MKKILLFLLAIASISCAQNSNKKMKKENNEEIKTQWVSLFDGETFNGWHQYNKSNHE